MSRKLVPFHLALTSQTLRAANLGEAIDFQPIKPCLYHAINEYADMDYGGKGMIIYAFAIERETACYYVMQAGFKLGKKLNNRTWSISPEDAVHKAMRRADNYLTILIRRGHEVSAFIRECNYAGSPKLKELRDFAEIAKQFSTVDDIPLAHWKTHDQPVDKIPDW